MVLTPMLDREGAVSIKLIFHKSYILHLLFTAQVEWWFTLPIVVIPKDSTYRCHPETTDLSKFRQPLARSSRLALIGRDIVFTLAQHCVLGSAAVSCYKTFWYHSVPMVYLYATQPRSACGGQGGGSAEVRRLKLKVAVRRYESRGH